MDQPQAENPYDVFPYPHLTHSHTHPERMATLATMLGIDPAPVNSCRVLELGCAAGFNLHPMAFAFPQSYFMGMDYSTVQIDYGLERIKELGLTNLDLVCRDIMDPQIDLGRFDYIIAHGLYSWVSDQVRDRLMQFSKSHLAPNGVFYVSYNTYPGWHMMGMIREMMLYHTRNIDSPLEKAEQARELIEFISEAVAPNQSGFGAYLEMYLELLRKKELGSKKDDGSLLLHDELEEFNEPEYFYQFVDRASRYGLQYLVESEFSDVIPSKFPQEVGERLRKMSRETIEMEQYLDFLNFRTFRRTLLCHEEIEVSRTLSPQTVYGFQLVSRARMAEQKPEELPDELQQFKGSDGAAFTTDHPLTVAAFQYLREIYPRSASFKKVVQEAARKSPLKNGDSLPDHANLVAANLLRAYSYSESLVEFHVHPPEIAVEVSDYPVASTIARWQLDHMRKVTNMRHERVELDPLARVLLRKLDGTLARHEILTSMIQEFEEGSLSLDADPLPAVGSSEFRDKVAQEIDKRLRFFIHASLMIG